ncbi:MAG TPA: 2-oxoacid:acceptor oxidoreductase [Clostridiaceae bacterium]|nr:2-oxoacid:acceptor oxidoreductase [Clostridiaceae bacterium]
MQEQQEKLTNKPRRCRVLGPVAYEYTAANTGSWRLERPDVDFSACIKCGTCEKYCPTNVITIKKDQKKCVEIDFNYCKGCGICANECPKKCIKMVPERSEG